MELQPVGNLGVVVVILATGFPVGLPLLGLFQVLTGFRFIAELMMSQRPQSIGGWHEWHSR